MNNGIQAPEIKPKLIEISKLTHRFPEGNTALDGISLEIEHGSFTVICGENGSGKTVLMKHLNGLLTPTEGAVLINGIDVKKDSSNARKTIGFVFQSSDTQIVAQTVYDDIAFGPENLGFSKEQIIESVDSAAEAMDIKDILQKSPHRLSGGEKKRTAIAGILAMGPEMIVLDEPFAGLDYSGVKTLIKKLIEIHNSGTAIIVITHDLEKILAHASRMIILDHGRIAADGPPQDLLEKASECGLRIPPNRKIEEMSWLK